jgi:hypothetical protein
VYRFDLLDRGVLFGRTRNELVVIAVGGTVWLASTITRTAPVPGLAVLAVCLAVSLAPAGRGSVVGWWPTWFGWFVRDRLHRRWYRPLHLATATPGDVQPELPPWLAGLSIIHNPDRWCGDCGSVGGDVDGGVGVFGAGVRVTD